MRKFFLLAGLSSLILLACLGNGYAQKYIVSEAKQSEPTIVGLWHANSVTLTTSSGTKKSLPINQQKPFNISITNDNRIVMRVGEQEFADMPYTFADMPNTIDAGQTPVPIDVKFQGQDMLGVFELKSDSLKITLNDKKNGRPKNIDDKDADMLLALKRFQHVPLMMINSDGTNLRPFFCMPEYTALGSPEWSHDGKQIVFDCWRSIYGEDYASSHVFVVNADRTSPKDLGDGTLPSWSPDGKQIVYCRYTNNGGIWIVNVDGSNLRRIDEGWGPDWSPKKDELAYSSGGNLCVYDLKTNKRRFLLEKQYSQIIWGLSWSSDGQWICFKGNLPDGGSEVAIVHREGQSKGFKVLLPNKDIAGVEDYNSYFSWSPDSKQILVPMKMDKDSNLQLYIFDPEGKNPPKILPGQNPIHRFYGSSWSPDGKNIVLSYWTN